MDMLPVLLDAKKALPGMLQDGTSWNSLWVNYHKPFVERLWRPWGQFRISLHCIYPCTREEALFHPHPWDSIVELVSGTYEMTVGYSDFDVPLQAPPVMFTEIIAPPTIYQIGRGGWHAVRPVDGPSHSLMISGPPRFRESISPELGPLNDAERLRLMEFFREIYDPQPK